MDVHHPVPLFDATTSTCQREDSDYYELLSYVLVLGSVVPDSQSLCVGLPNVVCVYFKSSSDYKMTYRGCKTKPQPQTLLTKFPLSLRFAIN